MMRTILAALVWLALAVPSQAQFADQMTWGGTGGGTTNAQTVTIANVGALADLLGVEVRFSPGATNTSATTLAASGLTATAMRKWSPAGLIALTGGELRSGVPVSVMYNGTFFVLLSPTMVQPAPTYQFLTTPGAGTYTTGVSGGQTARQIIVTIVGGGGGGGAATTNNGTAGGATTFESWTAGGGGAGAASGGAPGAAGTGGATGTGTQIFRVNGTRGGSIATDSATLGRGGSGGGSYYGGSSGGLTQTNSPGAPGVYGAGGAGGSSGANAGAGGASGETVKFYINNPDASYSIVVGTSGAGGSAGGNAGAAGGIGPIMVEEIYWRPPANDNELMGECRCAA